MKPRAHTFFARKESRKLDPANDQSTLIIIGDDQEEVLRVMLEHDPDKKYPVGGMCEKVKKGFTDNSGIPKFAIKKYNEVGFDLKEHRQIYRYAKRSEVISRHRGEKGIAVRLYHKQYLLNTWHDGDTLYAIHKQTPDLLMCCPIEKRLKFAVDILQEVATLHQLGLIHRDIKPANIMMNDDRAKLIDEDSVCLLHDDPARIGLICTKRYLDRELYERVILHLNAYKYFDKKSDVYALGLTLCYLFPDLFDIQFIDIEPLFGNPPQPGTPQTISVTELPHAIQHRKLVDFIKTLISPEKEKRPECAWTALIECLEICQDEYHVVYPLQCILQDESGEDEIRAEFLVVENQVNTYDFNLSELRYQYHHIRAATAQLTQMMKHVAAMDKHDPADGDKYAVLHELQAIKLSHHPELYENELRRVAKLFFHVAFQRISGGIYNMSTSGEEIYKNINDLAYIKLKRVLFPDKHDRVRYRELRAFICGHNDKKLFSNENTNKVLANYHAAKNKPKHRLTVEDLDHEITYRSLR